MCLLVEILQLRIIPFEKRLQLTNDLEVYTSKVVASAAFRYLVGHISLRVSGMLLQCFYLALFLDTTTFEVNMTAYNLENSLVFDSEA